MAQIRNVVFHTKGRYLLAIMLVDGVLREVKYQWWIKSDESTVPDNWYEAVLGEVEFQRGERLKESRGAPTLPPSGYH